MADRPIIARWLVLRAGDHAVLLDSEGEVWSECLWWATGQERATDGLYLVEWGDEEGAPPRAVSRVGELPTLGSVLDLPDMLRVTADWLELARSAAT